MKKHYIECSDCEGHGAFSRDYSHSAHPSDNCAHVCSRCRGTGRIESKNPPPPVPSIESNLRAILALCDNPHFTSDRKYRIAELACEAIALLSK